MCHPNLEVKEKVKEAAQALKKPSFDVQRVRQDFPMLQQKLNGKPFIYLDSAASGQKPQVLIDRLSDFYANEYGKPNEQHTDSKNATEMLEETRQKVADLIKAKDSKEIVFVRGCTEAINVVASGFARGLLQEGDEIITTLMEHHANIVPWQMAAQDAGAVVKVVPITATGELDLAALENMISERTKIISLVHSSQILGTINPIKKITAMAHRKGVPVLVDGAQTAPHMPLDMQDLDCDFYTFSAHKMSGPTGVGVLYGKADWLEKLPPHNGGGEMAETVEFEKTTYSSPPKKFEAGTTSFADIIALGAVIDYHNALGMQAIADYEQELLEYGLEKLNQIKGLHILGSAPEKEPVVSFTIDGVDVKDLEKYLNNEWGIAVKAGNLASQPLMKHLNVDKALRASYCYYNTKEEIDTMNQAIEAYLQTKA
ncbi:aminotransferase class V-fold PLP-dependent enzyme [Rufibacter sp. XAAS-G3-1]|uniref:aminotransferase class V-fold PLP-dependent enzyme n=1 Tax=Rufibacter sp. XAAS-G3-1 TaxID=2729134 RepID=UPI00210723C8|nr:cysteine desulfurase [Rufibacter sp. XAAS-G3-1]